MLKSLVDDPASVLSHWPEKPQRFHRDPAEFEALLTLGEVNTLVDAECLPMRNVVLLKDSKIEPPETYVSADGVMPRFGAVRRFMNEGGSLSVRKLETLKPSIADLYRELRRETGYGVHINAYLTPPGQQGLKYHYDPYVTLILQFHGCKLWPVHSPFVENPVQEYASFHTEGFTTEQKRYLANTPPEMEFTLEPGDVLWLPRGFVHSPYTVGDEPSLHLTVAFKERTKHWAISQLVNEILANALVDPAMRAEIQPADLLGDPAAVAEKAREYLLGALMLLEQDEIAEAVRGAARRPIAG